MPREQDPIERLVREHEEGWKRLSQMENAANSIQTNGFSAEAFEQIAMVIRWMNTDVRVHTRKEEMYLFPLLERHDVRLAELLRAEHRELWNALSDLLETVKDVEEGKLRGTSIQEVVRASMTVVNLLKDHIVTENTILFPLVKRVLTAEEYQQLRNAIRGGEI